MSWHLWRFCGFAFLSSSCLKRTNLHVCQYVRILDQRKVILEFASQPRFWIWPKHRKSPSYTKHLSQLPKNIINLNKKPTLPETAKKNPPQKRQKNSPYKKTPVLRNPPPKNPHQISAAPGYFLHLLAAELRRRNCEVTSLGALVRFVPEVVPWNCEGERSFGGEDALRMGPFVFFFFRSSGGIYDDCLLFQVLFNVLTPCHYASHGLNY